MFPGQEIDGETYILSCQNMPIKAKTKKKKKMLSMWQALTMMTEYNIKHIFVMYFYVS